MKTVLLIAYYYPPLGGMGTQRALKWARYLADFGWHAIVLTPGHGAYFIDATLDDGTAYGVEIVRTPLYHLNPLAAKTPATPGVVAASPASSSAPSATLKGRLKNLVKTWLYFPDGQNGWFFPALRAGDKLLKTRQIDAIVSTSFPVTAHFVAARLARKYDVPWVADYRDLWTQNQTDDLHVSRARQRFDQRAERRLLHKAAAVTTVSKGQARELQKVTGKKKRAALIRNGFDSEDFSDLEQQRPDKWTLTFVGTYYSFYAPQTLFAVLARLISKGRIDRNKVRFRVIGDPSAELRVLLQQAELEDITEFTGFVSYRTALQHQVNASLLLLMVTSDRSKPGVIHGKTFEYLGARRPILTLAPPEFEVAEIVRESGAGTVVEPHDEKGIEACLLHSYDEYTSGADNGSAPADIARYERRAGAQQLAQLLDELSFKTSKITIS